MLRTACLALTLLTLTTSLEAQEGARAFDPLPGGGQVYTVDGAHSLLDFAVRLVGFNRVRGSFTDWSADLFYDPAAPSHSSLDFVATVASIATGVEERDGDLKRPNFFDATRFPRMRFHSTGAVATSSGIRITGILTIRDSARPIEFEARVIDPMAIDPFGNWRISFGSSVTINRRDFGVVGPVFWNNAISDSVNIEMEVAARLWDYFRLNFSPRHSLGELLYNAADSGRLDKGLTTARALAANQADTTVNTSAWEFEKAAMRLVQLKRLDDARRILEFALEVMRTPPAESRSEIQARLAEVDLRMGRRDEARAMLANALVTDPNNTFAMQMRERAK